MSEEAWIAVGVVIAVVAIITFVGAVHLLLKVFRMRRHPVDLLPDPIYLDDMAVVGTALVVLTRLWRKRHGNRPLPHAPRPSAASQRPTAPTT
jgi:hypothetical protein